MIDYLFAQATIALVGLEIGRASEIVRNPCGRFEPVDSRRPATSARFTLHQPSPGRFIWSGDSTPTDAPQEALVFCAPLRCVRQGLSLYIGGHRSRFATRRLDPRDGDGRALAVELWLVHAVFHRPASSPSNVPNQSYLCAPALPDILRAPRGAGWGHVSPAGIPPFFGWC